MALGAPVTTLNMNLQVSMSHMQVLETPVENKYLCFRKEMSRKAESFVNRKRNETGMSTGEQKYRHAEM